MRNLMIGSLLCSVFFVQVGCGDSEGGSTSDSNQGGAGGDVGQGGTGNDISVGGSAGGAGALGGGGAGGEVAPTCADNPSLAGCITCDASACEGPDLCCGAAGSATCGADCGASTFSLACDGDEDCPGQACCTTLLVESGGSGNTLEAESTCQAICPISSSSTANGQRVRSVACESGSDCAGLANEFGVPYKNCCAASGAHQAVCVSDTSAGYDFVNCN